ncbi:phosphonate metabolism transcriptional regulator PhnF [Roseomonas sp. NAR14]|uniref:Phosphonate metabolism transcriptional regulator PhnF n=1 Tax=Roseomonas acroporae TaxID=2937791 RepID=A0A9X1YAB2_9PROT|nr:phosphonate metabolism transcriptional regulator PhnF [Roseomonas acroporae]MCK8785723.1 phosphonate metabolism transcriptional regulator PhnF [Roseomonas acroporae]
MDTPLPRDAGVAAWKQIADALEAGIAAGRPGPGERLPTEAQFAARFGVNRHTVRRALAALAERGLIRSAQGSGSFVEAAPLRYPIGARTRFSEIVSGAGREAYGDLIAATEVPAGAALAAALGIAAGAPVLEMLTRHRADGTPISMGRACLPLPRFAGIDRAYAEAGSLTRAYAAFGVTDYRRLETRITARPADAAEAALLELAPGRVVLVTESVNLDQHGVPIQATRSQFAADRVELVVTG